MEQNKTVEEICELSESDILFLEEKIVEYYADPAKVFKQYIL